MTLRIGFSWHALILILIVACIESKRSSLFGKNTITVKSIKCVNHDESYIRFLRCDLKAINRTMKMINMKVELLKPPLNSINANLTAWKKANGYKPFGFNVVVDMCRYYAGHGNIAYDWYSKFSDGYTNLNHTCPYSGILILNDMPLANIKLPSLVPDGDYRLDLQISCHGALRGGLLIYATILES